MVYPKCANLFLISKLQLCSITILTVENKRMRIADEPALKLENIFDVAKRQPDFGNGRYARNVIEKAQVKHAAKLVNFVYNNYKKLKRTD